jgi:hypothetical protein
MSQFAVNAFFFTQIGKSGFNFHQIIIENFHTSGLVRSQGGDQGRTLRQQFQLNARLALPAPMSPYKDSSHLCGSGQ